MSKTSGEDTRAKTSYRLMNNFIFTLMHFLGEKLENGPDRTPTPPSDLKTEDKDATMRCLIDFLPKRRPFAYYRTAQKTHDEVLVYWRGLEDLHRRGVLYDSSRVRSRQVQMQITEILCFIGNARLWGCKEVEVDEAELKAFEEAAAVVVYPNFGQ